MEEELRRLLRSTWPYRQTQLGGHLVREFVCLLQSYKQADRGNIAASVEYLKKASIHRGKILN